MSHPFLELGETTLRPRRRLDRPAKAPAQVLTPAEKKIREQSAQLRHYRAAWREKWRAALTGPHGSEFAALKRVLRRYGPNDAAALVEHVESLSWLPELEPDERAMVFRLVGNRIARIREDLGLAPFDDGLSWLEPDPAFVRCRTVIMGSASSTIPVSPRTAIMSGASSAASVCRRTAIMGTRPC